MCGANPDPSLVRALDLIALMKPAYAPIFAWVNQ